MAFETPSALPPTDAVFLVLGAGFIGSHTAAELVRHGRTVIVADKQPCAFPEVLALVSQFIAADLRVTAECDRVIALAAAEAQRMSPARPRVWVLLFAADMGGMGYIASNETAILLSNTTITINTVKACIAAGVERLFLASSACVYPVELQLTAASPPALREDMAWPAHPQDGYGLEKLYGEEVAMRAASASAGLLQVRVARFHNVYGPRGTWIGGREKAPAAFLRKAMFLRMLDESDPAHGAGLEVWGDGSQTRTFCFITDAVAGVLALMCSDVDSPVNIGSDEVVTVKELACLAGETLGIARTTLQSRLVLQPAGPIGVQGRSADLSLAKRRLGWAPRVDLAAGLRDTAAWLQTEVSRVRDAVLATADGARAWYDFLSAGLSSPHLRVAETRRFGLLVPVTSRHRGREVEAGIRAFLASLRSTISTGSTRAWQYDIIFGVDVGDSVLDPSVEAALDLAALVRAELPLAYAAGAVTCRVRTFQYPPGSICRIWSDLAADAFSSGDDLAVLLGDDVILQSPGWADAIWEAFVRIANSTGLPFGFACVAFADDAFAGFPTFPVLHRTHSDVFGGRVIPTSFRNQDADPFLFQLYRGFGAAVLEPSARLTNTIGGAGDARYVKRHVRWTGSTLNDARAAAAHWLDLRLGPAAAARVPTITLDVIVPTYRVPRAALERILALHVPPDVSTQFTIICDRPDHDEAMSVVSALQMRHRDNAMVRIRTNDRNLGAGPTRNNGLAESAADWVLFLDDDVIPDAGILDAYAAAIRAHPRATGFIGHSVLPPPTTGRQVGVHSAGVAFFWGVATAFPTHTDLPWGVTANLCVRRPVPGTVEFSSAFPKTGGGEDIDFCLRLREHVRSVIPDSEGFVAAPAAVITHPWWDNGIPKYSHFSGWAYGDGHLIDLFPALTYRNLPDLTETLLLLSCAAGAQLASRVAATSRLATRLPASIVAALQRVGSSRALACTVAAAGACVLSDLLVDAWMEFVERPVAHGNELPLTSRVSGVVHGLAIRTASEAGRLVGHTARGRLVHNFGRRFNWFGYMWDGAPAVERGNATRRTLARAATAAAAVSVVALVLRTWFRR